MYRNITNSIKAILLAVMFLSMPAHAGNYGIVTVGCYHYKFDNNFGDHKPNQINPGLGVVHEFDDSSWGVGALVYDDSYKAPAATAFATYRIYRHNTVDLTFAYGVVYGYRDDEVGFKQTLGLSPLVAAIVGVGPAQLIITPVFAAIAFRFGNYAEQNN